MDTRKYQIDSTSKKFSLASIDPNSSEGLTKVGAIENMVGNILDLRILQDKLYASGRNAVLIIFQAMDAAGKDSTINHVMSGINPQGCFVKSFKHPNSLELNHDYLWRSTRDLPERGMIGIFNRSYYEEVLIAKVHPEIVLHQKLPNIIAINDITPAFWEERYAQIRNYEKRLHTNGIKVIKFFLHISKEEQAKRFLKRIKREDKNWKFSDADMKERAFWGDYQSAYEQCIKQTASDQAPWNVIPSNHKWFARALVSQIIVDEINALSPQYPNLNEESQSRLKHTQEQLERELGLTNKN